MIFFPWYPALMLAWESSNVIDIRLRKMTTLTPAEAQAELNLMISEKMQAVVETTAMMMCGGSASEVVSHYRQAVSANAERLRPAI